MIEVSRAIPVNEPGQPKLTRSDVWKGLVMKADNALPFVPAMTNCEVQERMGPNQFVREIEFRGERCHERVTLSPEDNVLFERLDGSVLGTIRNRIEDGPDGLALRFSFALRLSGVDDGAQEEKDYGAVVEKDYLKAVDATLAAIRKLKAQRDETIDAYYKAVDAMDMIAFRDFHDHPESSVTFGNYPAARGPDAISGAIGAFWGTIGGMKHEVVNRWDEGDTTILEVKVAYTRQDGGQVTIPCVSIIRPEDGKIRDLRVYIDVAPIYAAMEEPATA